MNDKMNQTQKNDINKQKKIILITIAVLVAFVVLYVVIASIDFSKIFGGKDTDTESNKIYFYDEELSKNIFQDEKYMELNRTVTFVKASSGNGETILDSGDAVESGPAVNILYNMIGYILTGNHAGYNSCFSDYYYANGGEQQGRFTQQKIYNIVITEVSVTDKMDDTGATYKEYYYTLEYMIRHNNGSLRNDMGSDCVKAQHLILSEKYSDEMLIDKMYTIDYIIK